MLKVQKNLSNLESDSENFKYCINIDETQIQQPNKNKYPNLINFTFILDQSTNQKSLKLNFETKIKLDEWIEKINLLKQTNSLKMQKQSINSINTQLNNKFFLKNLKSTQKQQNNNDNFSSILKKKISQEQDENLYQQENEVNDEFYYEKNTNQKKDFEKLIKNSLKQKTQSTSSTTDTISKILSSDNILNSENNHYKDSNQQNKTQSDSDSNSIYKHTHFSTLNFEILEKYCGQFVRDPSNGKLTFTRPDIEQQQMQVINKILQQVGSNLLQGKLNPRSICLPVALFTRHTLLMKFSHNARIIPHLVHKIRSTPDPVLKVAQQLCHYPLITNFNIEQAKPFNPTWGETYQATVGDQDISIEQVVHNPPISMIQMCNQDKSSVYQGYNNLAAGMGVSTWVKNYGKDWLILDGNAFTSLVTPRYVFGNILIGKRQFYLQNRQVVQNKDYKLVGLLQFDSDEVSGSQWRSGFQDKVVGQVVEVEGDQEVEQLMKMERVRDFEAVQGGVEDDGSESKGRGMRKGKGKNKQVKAKLSGHWTTGIQMKQNLVQDESCDSVDDEFDYEKFMNLGFNNKNSPVNIQDIEKFDLKWPCQTEIEDKYKLPSCSSKRKDLMFWIKNDETNADEAKLKEEQNQRKDRKIRKNDQITFIKPDQLQ